MPKPSCTHTCSSTRWPLACSAVASFRLFFLRCELMGSASFRALRAPPFPRSTCSRTIWDFLSGCLGGSAPMTKRGRTFHRKGNSNSSPPISSRWHSFSAFLGSYAPAPPRDTRGGKGERKKTGGHARWLLCFLLVSPTPAQRRIHSCPPAILKHGNGEPLPGLASTRSGGVGCVCLRLAMSCSCSALGCVSWLA